MGTVHTIQELKNLLDPLAIYGEYVRLTRKGRRSSGLCPFHREKTPSFSVDGETGLFYCFGCHKGGDLLQFVQEAEGCSFSEALEILASRAGVTLDTGRGRGTGPQMAPDRKEILRKVLATAELFYREALKEQPAGSAVRSYLVRRGIAPAAEERFGLGFAPPAGGLMARLAKEGYRTADAVEAGLVLERDRGGSSERFRNRLLFPIRDALGRTVGFGGRALGDDEPKYLNSPETPVFQKRDVLFGLCWTKEAVRRSGTAVLVEGYMDFVTAYGSGVDNAVAGLGTALAQGQAALLSRYAREVVLCYDSDTAGREAARRSAPILLGQGLGLRVVTLPAGKDPDDCVREAGAEALRGAVAGARPFFEHLVEQAQASAVLSTVEGRVAFVDSLAEHLLAVADPLKRQEYAKEVAGRAGLDPDGVLRRVLESARGRKDETPAPVGKAPEVPVNEQMLVKGLTRCPAEARPLVETLGVEVLGSLTVGPLLKRLLAGEGPEGPAQTAVLAFIEHSCHEAATPEAVATAVRSLRRQHLVEKQRRIRQQIAEAGQRGDLALVQVLNREMMAVATEVRGLEPARA